MVQLSEYIDAYIQAETMDLKKIYTEEEVEKIQQEAIRGYMGTWYKRNGKDPIYDKYVMTKVENPALVSFNNRLSQTKHRDYEHFMKINEEANASKTVQEKDCVKIKNYDECVVDLNQCKWHPPIGENPGKCKDVLRTHDDNLYIHASGNEVAVTSRALSIQTQRDLNEVSQLPHSKTSQGETKVDTGKTLKGGKRKTHKKYGKKRRKSKKRIKRSRK